MTIPDLVNALFEAAGGIMVWTNVRALARDRQVKGVNVWATVLFNAWGIWNLWYYPHLGQWASFAGGLVIVSANTCWIWLAWKYRPRPECKRCNGFGMVKDTTAHKVAYAFPKGRVDYPLMMCPECTPNRNPNPAFCDVCGRQKPVPAHRRWREGSASVYCGTCMQGDWDNPYLQRRPGFRGWLLAMLGRSRP